jgi:hypothetical protein
VSPRPPDVEIAVTARVGELRFGRRPEARVVAYSNVPAVVRWVSDRKHLPDDVEPGVTYRDVAVAWGVVVQLEEQPPQ